MEPQKRTVPKTELMLPRDHALRGLDSQLNDQPEVKVPTEVGLSSRETHLLSSTPAAHSYYVVAPYEKAHAYTVIEQIGKGSQAEIFLATDSEDRTVMVKRITQALDQETVDRFEYEVQVTRDIHPYAPRITDAGLFNGKPFYARRFIDGFTLDQSRDLRPIREGIRGLDHVCDTLDRVHELGYLHGDLKGDNIIIDPQGKGWLIDLGLTAPLDADGDYFIGGTYNFISPEQFNGRPCRQSDIYSLGLTLYELASGKPARDLKNKNNRERTRIIIDADKPDLTGLPSELADIITTCIHKDPADRYPTALDLKTDLARYAHKL